jgi:hypothetical protein
MGQLVCGRYTELVADADGEGGDDKTAAAATIQAKLLDIGFPPDQAAGMAAALAAQPQAAAGFAQMPLIDLLQLVPPGALTRDVFHIGGGPVQLLHPVDPYCLKGAWFQTLNLIK